MTEPNSSKIIKSLTHHNFSKYGPIVLKIWLYRKQDMAVPMMQSLCSYLM